MDDATGRYHWVSSMNADAQVDSRWSWLRVVSALLGMVSLVIVSTLAQRASISAADERGPALPTLMVKKKDAEPEKGPWMLGKFSAALKVGLVGPPNVGKSTLYNSLSKSHHAEAANYPFCTINPSETRALLEDSRLDWLVGYAKPKTVIKSHLSIVDIAGLIKGAHAGAGLGNSFLSHINSVDGIIHVVRAFEDADVIHHDDKPDPVTDMQMISDELRLKDISMLEGMIEMHTKKKAAAATKSPADKKAFEQEADAMARFLAHLQAGKSIRSGLDQWTATDIEYLNEYKFLTAKPIMYAVNLCFKDYQRKKNKWLKPIFDWINANDKGSAIIPYCGSYEGEMQELEPEEFKAWENDENKAPSALQKMIRNAFSMVNLINFFTFGPDEVRAWNIRRGFLAPKAGSVIHGDFEKAFIMAEVMAVDDLIEAGSVNAVKDKGKWRQEGKTYMVQDGDCIEFKVGQITEKKKVEKDAKK